MLKRAIVYSLKGNEAVDNMSLLYSLRSLESHLEDHPPVFIMGTKKPRWLDGSKVTMLPCNTRMAGLRRSTYIADEIMWMEEDIILLRDTTWEELSEWRVQGVVTPMIVRDILRSKKKSNRGRMLRKLEESGYPTIDYSTRTPYVYNADILRNVLEDYDIGPGTPVELAYGNTAGVTTGDSMTWSKQNGAPKSAADVAASTDVDIFSFTNKAFKDFTRGFLAGMFRTPSNYEL